MDGEEILNPSNLESLLLLDDFPRSFEPQLWLYLLPFLGELRHGVSTVQDQT
jgi:hypothetical protein